MSQRGGERCSHTRRGLFLYRYVRIVISAEIERRRFVLHNRYNELAPEIKHRIYLQCFRAAMPDPDDVRHGRTYLICNAVYTVQYSFFRIRRSPYWIGDVYHISRATKVCDAFACFIRSQVSLCNQVSLRPCHMKYIDTK